MSGVVHSSSTVPHCVTINNMKYCRVIEQPVHITSIADAQVVVGVCISMMVAFVVGLYLTRHS